jgi:hypothetical protein
MQQNSPSSNGSPPASPNGSSKWSAERAALHAKRSTEIAQAMVDGLNRHSREKARLEAERARLEAEKARGQSGGSPALETPK